MYHEPLHSLCTMYEKLCTFWICIQIFMLIFLQKSTLWNASVYFFSVRTGNFIVMFVYMRTELSYLFLFCRITMFLNSNTYYIHKYRKSRYNKRYLTMEHSKQTVYNCLHAWWNEWVQCRSRCVHRHYFTLDIYMRSVCSVFVNIWSVSKVRISGWRLHECEWIGKQCK